MMSLGLCPQCSNSWPCALRPWRISSSSKLRRASRKHFGLRWNSVTNNTNSSDGRDALAIAIVVSEDVAGSSCSTCKEAREWWNLDLHLVLGVAPVSPPSAGSPDGLLHERNQLFRHDDVLRRSVLLHLRDAPACCPLLCRTLQSAYL
jgi:hypothetical protein